MTEKMGWTPCQLKVNHEEVNLPDEKALNNWLLDRSNEFKLTYLLAFAEDGVIWGKVDDQLALSSQAYPEEDKFPPLTPLTLQSLRLFGQNGEILLWREDGAFKARILEEGDGDPSQYREYELLLWGAAEKENAPKPPFSLYREGAQGFLHAPPVDFKRAALVARDYLDQDGESGQVYVRWSRLVGLVNKEGGR